MAYFNPQKIKQQPWNEEWLSNVSFACQVNSTTFHRVVTSRKLVCYIAAIYCGNILGQYAAIYCSYAAFLSITAV